MPLPADETAPWPPPEHAEIQAEIRRWNAWYTGDPDELASVYETHAQVPTHYRAGQPFRGGIAGAMSRMFWGQPVTPGQQSTKLHLPAASVVASTSAQLLFGEPPRMETDDQKTNARLEELFDESLWAELLEAAELSAGLGGVYLRVGWDKGIADRALVSVIGPDLAVPVFRWGRLQSVTFTWVLEVEQRSRGHQVVRYLEDHTVGRVEHALYIGDAGTIGKRVPLTEHPQTEALATKVDSESSIATKLDVLDVRYVPNRPSRKWRTHPVGMNLGQPDIAGVEPLLDALDEAWTSWMRDVRLGKARLVVPQDQMESRGPGLGAMFDLNRELLVPVKMSHETGGAVPVELVQPLIRTQEHAEIGAAIYERVVDGCGYSAQTFGLSGEVAMTATESNARERKTNKTQAGKTRYFDPELAGLAELMLTVDVKVFGREVAPLRPRISWPPVFRDSLETLARTTSLMEGTASTKTKVRTLHPEWEKQEVDEEVALILSERPALPDPFGELDSHDPNASGDPEPGAPDDEPATRRATKKNSRR